MTPDYSDTSIYLPCAKFVHNFEDPGEPFMLVLGTSHTFGQNEDHYLIKNYADHIGNFLNLKVIRLGYPGCDNFELQMIFVDLMRSGLLHSPNLKFFIIEPRLFETTGHIPMENFLTFGSENYSRWIDQIRNHLDLWKTPKHLYNYTDNMLFYMCMPLGYKTPSDKIFDIATERLNHLQHLTPDKRVYIETPKGEVKRVYEDFQSVNTQQWETFYSLNKTISFVYMVLNCLPINIKKAWWTYNFFPKDQLDFFLKAYPDLANLLIVHSVGKLFKDRLPDSYTDYFAPCQHLTNRGNLLFFNFIKDNVERIYYDKET